MTLAWVAKLERLQHSFAKAVLGLKGNAAQAGALMELGLAPLHLRRARAKLLFWKRLCDAHPSSLLRLVFRSRHFEVQAGKAERSCLNAFRDVLHEWGFAEHWLAVSASPTWRADIRTAADEKECHWKNDACDTRSSLRLYRDLGLGRQRGVALYLGDTSNRDAGRVVTMCRLGHIMLMKTVARLMKWPSAGARCVLCESGEEENVDHFVCAAPRCAHVASVSGRS